MADPKPKQSLRKLADAVAGTSMPRATAWNRAYAEEMAKIFDALPDVDPKARPAYAAMAREVDDQFAQMKRAGIRVEFTKDDPYKTSAEMRADVRENKRLKVFRTAEDHGHPFLTREQNDKFRAVHDYFGHAQEGHQFGPLGEENAYRVHSAMFSPLAQRAMATETRGQNSWFNAGPHSALPPKERPFAKQKGALWPETHLGEYPTLPAPPKLARVGGDRVKVTPVVKELRSTPKEVAARIAAAHGVLDEPVVPFTPVARGFLDRGLIVPDAPVPSAGSPFPVRAVPKTNRQAMGHFRGMDAPANIDLIIRQMQRGQDLGGRTFYPSYAAVEETLAGRGMDPRVLLDATSAGSIRSPVTNELANASVIHWGLQRGLFDANALRGMSSKELEATAERLREAIADAFPGAPGIPLMGTHLGTYGNLATDTAPDAYKVLTYRSQKGSMLNPNRGNVPGIVLDTHEATGTTLGSPFHTYFSEQGGFTGPEYGLQEDLVRQVARSLNLSDRTAQAGRWSGGGKLTGLRSPPADYAQIFEDLVQWNAKQRGIGGATLLGGVAKGDDILYPFYGRKGFGPL